MTRAIFLLGDGSPVHFAVGIWLGKSKRLNSSSLKCFGSSEQLEDTNFVREISCRHCESEIVIENHDVVRFWLLIVLKPTLPQVLTKYLHGFSNIL